MKKESSPKSFRFYFTLILLLAVAATVGCSHKKTNRGHLYRCEWSFEHNRTPWIGCPPDSGCDDERTCGTGSCSECDSGQSSGLFGLLKKDGGTCCCNKEKKNKGFRRHCGMNPECTAKKPCCRTLGCGMWIDPSDPNTFATLGSGTKACGLTPFCSPMKPCCLTPHCGRVTNQPLMNAMSPQMLMLGNEGSYPMMQPSVTPTPVVPKPDGGNEQKGKKPTTVAGPTGLLISRGIVPGVSTTTNGGVVAAVGVATPVGVMTPAGVQLPNGMVNGNAVIRACAVAGCSAARPCCMTPGCGMWVPVSAVSNNATMLASALRTPGMANGVMQAGAVPGYVDGGVMTAHGIAVNRTGNGMLVNPISGQPVAGLSMNGHPQVGYPPIGYAPTGYSPGYPRYAPQLQQAVEEEEEEEEETVVEAETKSQMPVPRFHPIPTKPAFQRSEGMVIPNRTGGKSAANSHRIFSDDALDAAVEQAYLEGMSDAMNEVEAELEAQAQEVARAQLQEKVLNQAKKLQSQLDSQKELELQVLEMRKRQERAERKAEAQARELAEQVAVERAAKKQAAREAEMLRAQWQQAEIEQTALRQPQEVQPMQMSIPTGFNQSSVSPAHYNATAPRNGSGKSVFASAMDALKGNDERQPRGVPMPVQRMPSQQQAMMQTPPGYPAGSGGNGVMRSARSLGSSMVSAVSDAVSPLSGLLGSDRPTPPPGAMPYQGVPQNSMRSISHQPAQKSAPMLSQTPYFTGSAPVRTKAARVVANPCPPPYPVPVVQPKVTKRFAENGAALEIEDDADLSEPIAPKKPPVRKKAPKKVIDVDDEDDGPTIRQAHYEHRE